MKLYSFLEFRYYTAFFIVYESVIFLSIYKAYPQTKMALPSLFKVYSCFDSNKNIIMK